MDGELGRREGEDEPAAARIHRPGPKYLGQGRSGPPGVGAVEDGVGAIDRGGILSVAGLAVGTVEAVDGLLQ